MNSLSEITPFAIVCWLLIVRGRSSKYITGLKGRLTVRITTKLIINIKN